MTKIKVKVSNCLSCPFQLLSLIATIFILTHVSEIWHILESLIK